MKDVIEALYEAARYARSSGETERADRWFALADRAVDDAKPQRYTVKEAATKLECSIGSVWRWIRIGRLRSEHIGGRGHGVTFIPAEALAAFARPKMGRPRKIRGG